MDIFTNTTEVKLSKELRLSKNSFQEIAKIHTLINNCNNRVRINIMDTAYIHPALISTIAALPNLKDKKITIRYDKNNQRMYNLLESQGILNYYNIQSNDVHDNSVINFTKFTDDITSIPILEKISEIAPVKMTDEANSALISALYEIFANATTHSKSVAGAYCCGKWDTRRKRLIFSVYDLGIGIKKSVNTYLKGDYSTKATMDWAFELGNSTLNDKYPRGLGFTSLESFINLNKGKITICSSDGLFTISEGNHNFIQMQNSFIGTLIVISIRADNEHIYNIK